MKNFNINSGVLVGVVWSEENGVITGLVLNGGWNITIDTVSGVYWCDRYPTRKYQYDFITEAVKGCCEGYF